MPPGVTAFFLTENGLIGVGPPPPPGMENPDLIDAGDGYRHGLPRRRQSRQHLDFCLIRGGHLDLTVLGGLQVDGRGAWPTGWSRESSSRGWAGRWISSTAPGA